MLNAILFAVVAVALPALAQSSLVVAGTPFGEPDYVRSQAECEPCRLLVVPDGSGPSMDESGCTVIVTVVSADGQGGVLPVAYYPYQDVFLIPPAGSGVHACAGSWSEYSADANTDEFGQTTISLAHPPMGGQWSGGLYIGLGGVPIGWVAGVIEGRPVPIDVRSPDLNADGSVGLPDAALFAADLLTHGAEALARSDLNWDESIDLMDVGILARSIGASCP